MLQKRPISSGISRITSHAPSANLVTAMTIVTMAVATEPTPLITAERSQPGSRSLRQWTTMPACERVKLVNTPTAYNGMSASRLPLKTTSSTIDSSARATIPVVNASRSPRN